MKTLIVCMGIFLGGCSSGGIFDVDVSHCFTQNLSTSKQKQRIAYLEKKLEIAERDLQKTQDEVDLIQIELSRSQLALIEKQIDQYEKEQKEGPGFLSKNTLFQKEQLSPFLKEREVLQKMLENGPSPESFEAQSVLDKLLRVITESKNGFEE